MGKITYLFSNWENIRKTLKGKFIYLFLDYDGTLSPIADTPTKAMITGKTKDLLFKLSNIPNCKVAIISGRALNDISKRIGLKDIVYAGNHGFEIKGPKIKFKNPISHRYRKILEQIKTKLNTNLSLYKGVFIEDKGYCLTLHYRLADEKDAPAIEGEFYASTFLHEFKNDIKIRTGKKALEIRPPIPWNKGRVALWLLSRQLSAMRSKKMKVLPIYIGDDTTDEDAFESLKYKGMTIFVGEPKKTSARFYLKDTKEVARFLEEILYNLREGALW